MIFQFDGDGNLTVKNTVRQTDGSGAEVEAVEVRQISRGRIARELADFGGFMTPAELDQAQRITAENQPA